MGKAWPFTFTSPDLSASGWVSPFSRLLCLATVFSNWLLLITTVVSHDVFDRD